MRWHLVLVTLVVFGATGVPGRAAAGRAQRATVERHVFATVTDARGQHVEGLTAADFVVREDDVTREVLRVTPTAPPSHVALVVDNTGEAGAMVIELRAGLLQFVVGMAQQSPPPQMTLITTAERPTTTVPFSSSDALLERAIQRLFPRPGSGSYLLDAIVDASQALRKLKAERPVIVAFVIDAATPFSNHLHNRVANGLRDAGASLWAIELVVNVPPTSYDARERARVVGDVTSWSGGRNHPILSRQGIEAAFAEVLEAIVSRYDIAYGRPDTLIPPTRITVEPRDRALRVATTQWAAP